MRRKRWASITAASVLLVGAVAFLDIRPALAANPWGANYFPNVPLTTQDGTTVRFYDDLLKGKSVAINLIYTSCQDECPLETARLVQVQRLLGDRVGRDIFFYSISIDPKRDTPEVLKVLCGEVRCRTRLAVSHRPGGGHQARRQEAGVVALQRRRQPRRPHGLPHARQ